MGSRIIFSGGAFVKTTLRRGGGQKSATLSFLFNTATDGCGGDEVERNIKCPIINFRHVRLLFDRKKSGLRQFAQPFLGSAA